MLNDGNMTNSHICIYKKRRDNIITDEEHIINKHTEVNIYEDEFRKISNQTRNSETPFFVRLSA